MKKTIRLLWEMLLCVTLALICNHACVGLLQATWTASLKRPQRTSWSSSSVISCSNKLCRWTDTAPCKTHVDTHSSTCIHACSCVRGSVSAVTSIYDFCACMSITAMLAALDSQDNSTLMYGLSAVGSHLIMTDSLTFE